jgi:very-short-patch-repair endonuclease
MSITTSPDKAESLRAGGKAQHGFRAFGASDYWTDERREAKSAERKKFYEINPSMHPNRLCAGKKSYVQTQLFMHLASIGLRVEQEVRCGSYWIDIVIPEKMIAIEVDGEYFHQHRQDYDDDRSKFICQHYTIIRFPVKRLKQEFCECVAEIVSVAL